MNKTRRAYLFKRVSKRTGTGAQYRRYVYNTKSRKLVCGDAVDSRLQYLISALSSATKRTAPSLGECWIDSFCGLALGFRLGRRGSGVVARTCFWEGETNGGVKQRARW